MKKHWSILLVVCFLVMAGCKSDAVALTNPTPNSEKRMEELAALKADNEKFLERIAGMEHELRLSEARSAWTKTNPELEPLTILQQWHKIRVFSVEGEVILTDPKFLDVVSQYFIIDKANRDFPNGPLSDIDAFSVELTGETGTYHLEVLSRNYVRFPEVTYDIFSVSSDLVNLAKAFLPRPSYMQKEPLENRLLNSGALFVGSGENQFYYFSESRVRNIAKAFLMGNKKQVSDPEINASDLVDEIVFLSYGQKIQMKVYTKNIIIIDEDEMIFSYEIDPELSNAIHAQLSAG
jgi:hypothetical protein